MPIVFDQVNAEVAPPPQADAATPAAAAQAAASGGGEDAAEAVREKLMLWSQREQRLQAD